MRTWAMRLTAPRSDPPLSLSRQAASVASPLRSDGAAWGGARSCSRIKWPESALRCAALGELDGRVGRLPGSARPDGRTATRRMALLLGRLRWLARRAAALHLRCVQPRRRRQNRSTVGDGRRTAGDTGSDSDQHGTAELVFSNGKECKKLYECWNETRKERLKAGGRDTKSSVAAAASHCSVRWSSFGLSRVLFACDRSGLTACVARPLALACSLAAPGCGWF